MARTQTALAPLTGHRTLEEQTYQHLREAIARGTLAPGTKLVGSQLSLELGVSRITVANAIKRLASEGFVVVTPHKEASVALFDPTSLQEIFAIRHALEALVMRAAAERITPDELAQLRALDGAIREAALKGDLAGYRHGERAFHLGIYAAARLPQTTAILTDIWDRLEPYRGRRWVRTGLMNANHGEHALILDALAAHDGEGATALMQHHVAQGHERFLEALMMTP